MADSDDDYERRRRDKFRRERPEVREERRSGGNWDGDQRSSHRYAKVQNNSHNIIMMKSHILMVINDSHILQGFLLNK